jgi:hypothetical protein
MSPRTSTIHRTLNERLARLSEKELVDWADQMLSEITDAHALALDYAGWKIVCKDDPAHQWPLSVSATGGQCPPWCENIG